MSFGRTQLDTVFEGKVETAAYFNAVPGKNADALVEQAITDGADVVFTTSPKLVGASLRRRRPAPAGTHPELLDGDALRQHPHLLTRVYEAKFITARLPVPWRAGSRIGYRGRLPQLRRACQHQRIRARARMTNPTSALTCNGPVCRPD